MTQSPPVEFIEAAIPKEKMVELLTDVADMLEKGIDEQLQGVTDHSSRARQRFSWPQVKLDHTLLEALHCRITDAIHAKYDVSNEQAVRALHHHRKHNFRDIQKAYLRFLGSGDGLTWASHGFSYCVSGELQNFAFVYGPLQEYSYGLHEGKQEMKEQLESVPSEPPSWHQLMMMMEIERRVANQVLQKHAVEPDFILAKAKEYMAHPLADPNFVEWIKDCILDNIAPFQTHLSSLADADAEHDAGAAVTDLITATSIYEQLHIPLPTVLLTFTLQCILIIWYLSSLMEIDAAEINPLYFYAGVAISFIARWQLGQGEDLASETWPMLRKVAANGRKIQRSDQMNEANVLAKAARLDPKSKEVQSLLRQSTQFELSRWEWFVRMFCSNIANFGIAEIIAVTLPLFVSVSETPIDFVKDCLAATFIVQLDNLVNSVEFSVLPDHQSKVSSEANSIASIFDSFPTSKATLLKILNETAEAAKAAVKTIRVDVHKVQQQRNLSEEHAAQIFQQHFEHSLNQLMGAIRRQHLVAENAMDSAFKLHMADPAVKQAIQDLRSLSAAPVSKA